MKTINLEESTKKRVESLNNKIVSIYYDGFYYKVVVNDGDYYFFVIDVEAESINNYDEAITLTSKEFDSEPTDLFTYIIKGKVTEIFKVKTLLYFTKIENISNYEKNIEVMNAPNSPDARRVFDIVNSISRGYDEVVINPCNIGLMKSFPFNIVHVGYLLVIDSTFCLPLFSKDNCFTFFKCSKKNSKEFIKEFEDSYSFEKI